MNPKARYELARSYPSARPNPLRFNLLQENQVRVLHERPGLGLNAAQFAYVAPDTLNGRVLARRVAEKHCERTLDLIRRRREPEELILDGVRRDLAGIAI